MPRLINIDKEKKLLAFFITSTLILAFSGFLIFILHGEGYLAQFTGILHVVIGIPWAGIFIYYLSLHFARTTGSRKPGLTGSGILLAIIFFLLIASGIWLTSAGFDQNLSSIHALAAFAMIVIFLVHIVQGRRHLLQNKKSLKQLPHINKRILIISLASLAVFACFLVFLWVTAQPDHDHLFQELEHYEKAYGENPFAPSNLKTPDQQFIALSAVGKSENCQQCHNDIFEQWQSSIHRYAAADPAYVRNIFLLEESKGISATRYCEGCHAPIAMLIGELTPGGLHGGVADTPAFDEGISCRSCHSIDHILSTEGVASYHFTPTAASVFELSDNRFLQAINRQAIRWLPASHKTAFASPAQSTSTFCASCHAQFMDKRLNDWGWVKMQDDYSAWLNSPYSGQHDDTYSLKKTIRCQDCHMPLVPARDPAANADGKVRSHRFATANTFVAQHFNESRQLEKIIDFMQQNRMRISIDEPRRLHATESTLSVAQPLKQHQETPYYVYLGETLTLHIMVSNTGVGHDFPAGAIDLREAWIHLQILDAEGDEIMSSGNLDKNGFLEPDAYVYKNVPIDRHGREVWRHDLFNMTGESYRNIVKAGQTDRAEFTFTVPAWAKSPISIYATLKHRKLNRRYTDWVMGDTPYPAVPVIDVARDNLQVPVLKEPPVYEN